MIHIAQLTIFLSASKAASQKTSLTHCGKRAPIAQLAIDSDGDCPACRAAVESEHAVTLQILKLLPVDKQIAFRAEMAKDICYRSHVVDLLELITQKRA